MVMTDLRARLADALRKHRYLYTGVDKCAGCSWQGVVARDHDVHLADVLLSLPGIAIVDTDDLAQEIWQAYVIVVGRALPEGVADQMAALLAAANAAEVAREK